MKSFIWAKTLFEAYKYLGRVIKSIDRLVLSSGVHSYSLHQYGENTLGKMEAIIDLIQRKKRLVFIKLIIEEGVKNLDSEDGKLLIRYYFDNIPTARIAEELNRPRRTIQRNINDALENFMLKLLELGYNTATIEQLLENESWILGVYNSYVAKYQNKDKTLAPLTIPKLNRNDKLINSVYCGF